MSWEPGASPLFPPDTPKAAEGVRERSTTLSAGSSRAFSQLLLLPTLPLGLTMTVLAAAYDPETGAAAMAADSLMGAGPVACRSSSKILRCGDALIGIAGSPSFQRALRAYTPYEAGRDPRTWVEGLVDAVVAFGNERGHGGVQGNLRFHNFDGLVVLRGSGIWTIGGEGDASPVIDPSFWASGSGGEIALGAMYAMKANGLAPIANSFSAGMVKRAAEAACSLVPSCGGPIQIEELPPLLSEVRGELALEEPPGESSNAA